ncbi:hypothetical protein F4779DRAFT_598374 [Xylariaceae sp. FL0662B]|nr:hypothetical protein F4779DRAFT_598374 [Xylariaceae sp. FL0662B]
MKESTTLHFDLTEHADNTTVPFFVKWVYMNAATESESCVDIHKWTNRQIEWWDMIPIWHFADYVQAVELQNDIITVLHGIARRTDVLCDYDPVEALRLQPLPAESALFRLLAWSLTDMLLRECYTVHDLPDILWGLSIDLHAQVIACFCRYFTKVDILAENGEITMKKGIRKGVIRTISKIPPLEEFLEAVDEG